MSVYDVIVVGLGAHGSSTLYHLARRGLRVLGLEQFNICNIRGSSHGTHRLVRLAYKNGRTYVPLLLRSVELWRELEDVTGERLYCRSGVLSAAPVGDGGIGEFEASAREFGLAHEMLTATQINSRFEAFRVDRDVAGIFQRDSGFVFCERSVATHTILAMSHGVEIRTGVAVRGVEVKGGRVQVETAAGAFEAGQVVLSAGGWIGKLVPELQPYHKIGRRVLGWFVPRRPAAFDPKICPGFTFRKGDRSIYGFPISGYPGVKIGRDKHFDENGDPDELPREAGPRDEELLRDAMGIFLREVDGACIRLQGCIVTHTPDRDFIIDSLPDHPQVHVVSMCSGHGFKFSAVSGEIIADRVLGNRDRFDLSPFRLKRFLQ